MRKCEPVSRDGAMMAVWLCAIKGLLTTIVFLALPHSPAHLSTHPASYAQAQGVIDAQLARASATKAIIHVAKAAVAQKDLENKAPSTLKPFALLPANAPQLTVELLYLLSNENPDEKSPGLLAAAHAPRAPPNLRHERPPEYHYLPHAPVGLFIAWATPPPSRA